MKIIRLGDTEVVAGLEWSAIRSPSSSGAAAISEKKALASFLSSNKGSSRGVVVSVNDYTVVGRPEQKVKVKTKAPSAAAMFAMAQEKETSGAAPSTTGVTETEGTGEDHNWIIAEQIIGPVEGFENPSEPLFWLGIARNGLPLPGADIIVPRSKAIEEITEMLAASSGATVFTVDRDIRYHVVGHVMVVEKKFEDVVRGAGIDQNKAQVKMFSMAAPIAIGVVGVTVLVLGGYFGWEAWSNARAQELARQQAAQSAAEQARQASEETKKYTSDVRAALENGLRSGMTEISDAMAAASPYEMIEAWRDIIYNMELYQHTWNLKGVNCGVEGDEPFCVVSLARDNMGTDRVLLEERPDAIIEGDNAQYTLRGKPVAPRSIELPYLVSRNAFSRGLISDLQILRMSGISHTAEASKEVTKTVSLPEPSSMVAIPTVVSQETGEEVSGATTSVDIQLGVAKGEISIQGDQIYQISGIARYVDQPNIRANSLEVTFSDDTDGRWSLNLDYVVRTLPAPIVPPVPVGDEQIKIDIPEEYKSKVEVEGGMLETSGQATGPIGGAPADLDQALNEDPNQEFMQQDPSQGSQIQPLPEF